MASGGVEHRARRWPGSARRSAPDPIEHEPAQGRVHDQDLRRPGASTRSGTTSAPGARRGSSPPHTPADTAEPRRPPGGEGSPPNVEGTGAEADRRHPHRGPLPNAVKSRPSSRGSPRARARARASELKSGQDEGPEPAARSRAFRSSQAFQELPAAVSLPVKRDGADLGVAERSTVLRPRYRRAARTARAACCVAVEEVPRDARRRPARIERVTLPR